LKATQEEESLQKEKATGSCPLAKESLQEKTPEPIFINYFLVTLKSKLLYSI
jgi:hypothetical protein